MKRFSLLVLFCFLFNLCFPQGNRILSYQEIAETDSVFNNEIQNHLYLASYEYYYAHFQFPSNIDTFFNFVFKSLSIYTKRHPFPNNIRQILTDNRPFFSLNHSQDTLFVLYGDSIFLSFVKPFSGEEFNETGSYAGFIKNNTICNNNYASKLEKRFCHKLWKLYHQSVADLSGQHILGDGHSSLLHIGLTYDFFQDSLVVHNICPLNKELYQPYYASLKMLSRHFCHRYGFDGLFFTTPFVTCVTSNAQILGQIIYLGEIAKRGLTPDNIFVGTNDSDFHLDNMKTGGYFTQFKCGAKIQLTKHF